MTLIGKILAGRYEILEEIGSGGMAVVYKAKCQLLNRFVAVKVLRPDLQNDEEFVRRFNVEAQSAASLTHPNIVSIYDVGYESGLHYIVMEYIEGKTLKEYIEEKYILPWREACEYTIQVAKGLEQAHKNSIIHRDVKPHNIIMTSDGIMKVTDFGIARANVQSTVTCEDSAIGSVHYISPEQARGGYTDERSDIYSLGVVLYEMLTGKVPFDSDRPVTVAIMHLQEKPIMPRELNLSIPRPIENIVLKAMSKEISARYKNVSEMIADIQSVLNDPDREIPAPILDGGSTEEAESSNMEETIKMPAVKTDMDFGPYENKTKIEQQDVRPIFDESGNDKDNKEDEFMASEKRRTAVTVDKKKQNKVTWIAILSAVALLALMGIWIFNFLGFANLFGCAGSSEVVEIPKIEGLLYDDAVESLRADTENLPYNFSIIKKEQVESDKPEGIILSQDPAPGNKVKLTQEEVLIYVKVSVGREKVELRDYSKYEYRDAELQLQNLGFIVEIERKFSNEIPKDSVIGQNPVAGAMVSKSDKIILYVSDGPEEDAGGTIRVGNYVGKAKSAAEQEIRNINLEVAVAERYSDTVATGHVISQNPSPNAMVNEGRTVTIYVSKGPDPNNNSGGGTNDAPNPPENNDPPQQDQRTKKSTDVTLYGPKDKESAVIQVYANGNLVHTANLKKNEHKKIKLESYSDTIQVEVFSDGVSQGKRTVTLK